MIADRLAFWRDELAVEEPREVEFLTGGVSSIVIRVTTTQGAFVIKQALSQLRVEAPGTRGPRARGSRRVRHRPRRLVPGSVPEVVAVVPGQNAFVMRSAPAGPRRGSFN